MELKRSSLRLFNFLSSPSPSAAARQEKKQRRAGQRRNSKTREDKERKGKKRKEKQEKEREGRVFLCINGEQVRASPPSLSSKESP
jgi:hypothetical protein